MGPGDWARYARAVRLRLFALTAVIAMSISACGTTASSTHRGADASPSAITPSSPLPAGSRPSEISKMVCKSEAQQKIAQALGTTAVVETPTWRGHLYSCRYAYPNGGITLSVKELSSWGQTLSYFRGLGAALGRTETLPDLGQDAFQVRNGSVVVRKDWKVLLVDVSGLPAQFGTPATPSGNVAVVVADLILGCWSGD